MNVVLRLLSALAVAAFVPQSIDVPTSVLGYETQDGIEIVGRYYILGKPSHAAGQHRVWINYFATLSGPREKPLVSEMLQADTTYSVTATAAIDATHVAVAGQSSTTSSTTTVVELWTLRQPTVQVTTDPVTHERTHQMDVGAVTNRQQVLSLADVAGKNGVRRLVKVRGKPASLFVQFHDSGDLYELDCTTSPPTLTKRLSPNANAGVPQVAELNESRFKWLSGRKHKQEGCMYVLEPELEPGNAQIAPFCYGLFDANCDGTIDSWKALTTDDIADLYGAGYDEIELATRW
jgi:hypothetical protein